MLHPARRVRCNLKYQGLHAHQYSATFSIEVNGRLKAPKLRHYHAKALPQPQGFSISLPELTRGLALVVPVCLRYKA